MLPYYSFTAVPIVNITDDQYSQVIGSTAVIPCALSGDDATSAYWTFTDSNGEQNLTSGGRYSVATLPNPDLTISTINTTDTGTYKCKASNAAGESSDMATLSVTGGPPTIIIESQYTKLIGEIVTIPCTVSGTPAVTSVEWTFTPSGGSEQVLNTSDKFTINDLPNPELQISSLNQSDSGRYTCKATSAAGQSSKSTTLTIKGGTLNVVITGSPTTKIGEDVTINCAWSGEPNATTIQWKRNDSVLDIGDNTKYSGGTVTVPSLTIKSVALSDTGSYQCIAINAAGPGESSKVTLTLTGRNLRGQNWFYFKRLCSFHNFIRILFSIL
ncbi:hypothetical protein FSP39_015356 [Pinctada imbricata]|uniref:Ig-like domain-containing protein n=1 Tax=Pinctada imbricata TaxID=66713 RepID=A0AA88Y537_PINIB|nr:hypothetical protein FSP39_015356 [Pinctada imbricata]